MPRERVAMRKIREILRLVWSCGQSRRAVARAVGVGKATVDDTVSRALAAGLSWPLLYRHWRKKLDLSMRQDHPAGEKLFVDYSGTSVPIVDASSGEIRQAELFVAVMGCTTTPTLKSPGRSPLPTG